MNRQLHIELEAMTALHESELTREDWALLQIHLAYCPECSAKFEQYQQILSQIVPAMAESAARETLELPIESAASFEAAERRLMQSLPAQAPSKGSGPSRVVPWKVVSLALAACLFGLAAMVGAHHLSERKHDVSATGQSGPPVPSIRHSEPDPLQAQLASAQEKLGALERQAQTSANEVAQSRLAQKNAEQQLRDEESKREQIDTEREQLKQQLAAVQTEETKLRDQVASATSGALQQATQTEALENKVHLLSVELTEKETALDANQRMLALDKDFLAHDRDIRDLIGARNLYIADIFDTGENGKTAKPFGRIFYTKDRSLVFYGFDLDKQSGVSQAASFQVWGSGSDKQPVSLGMFYQDDSHKRWVLRCNDEKALARLNMVFVTVEPPGGSNKPTGKQLLRAYLQIQPNHP